MTAHTPNGNGPSWRWLVGILITAVFALLAVWGRGLAADVAGHTRDNTRQDREIAAVQTEASNLKSQLDRIERKVDRLLEERR